MTGPRRLMEASESELARALLREGVAERSSRNAMNKTLVTLGLGSAVTTTAASAGAAATGTTATAATVAKAGMGAIVAKVGLSVFVGTLAVAGAVHWMRGRTPAPQTKANSAVTTNSMTAPNSLPTISPNAAPRIESSAAASAEPAASASTTTSVATAHPIVKASLAPELAIVESARTSLAAGDTTSCLAALDKYDREHPRGAFAQEVVVMRIEAYVRRGDLVTARALADRFLAGNPSSPYATRVRSLVHEASNP